MIAARPVAQHAEVARDPGGNRFRLVSEPADGDAIGTVIAVHAFAEEMNKSRRMCARMANLLAAAGWRVVQRDMKGCGDSGGDFGDASWAAWRADLEEEMSLADANKPVWMWGLRAGALLVAEASARWPRANLLLWQPVASGAQHLQQFLRLHAGARIVGSAKSGDEPSPAQRLRSGEKVEVAGYELAPALCSGLEASVFDLVEGFAGRVVWIDVADGTAPLQLSAGSARVIDRLRAAQIEIDASAVAGPAFWKTQEIEECEALLERSLTALSPDAEDQLAESAKSAELAQSSASPELRPGLPTLPMVDSPENEDALEFRCEASRLFGVVSLPPAGSAVSPLGVVIAVGGPQYRVGSHRQFVLLARSLARQGFASLRFDYRGMGDSSGDMRTFEDVGPDLRAAVQALRDACPQVDRVVIWGLCDAASAAMMNAASRADVAGIIAVNPWARSDASLAAVQVKHYYAERLMQRDFWRKLFSGRVRWGDSFRSLVCILKRASGSDREVGDSRRESFQTRMANGLAAFRGRMLLVVAGGDLTAKEFLRYAETSKAWSGLLMRPAISRVDIPLADHTFSSRAWRAQVEDASIEWLRAQSVERIT